MVNIIETIFVIVGCDMHHELRIAHVVKTNINVDRFVVAIINRDDVRGENHFEIVFDVLRHVIHIRLRFDDQQYIAWKRDAIDQSRNG